MKPNKRIQITIQNGIVKDGQKVIIDQVEKINMNKSWTIKEVPTYPSCWKVYPNTTELKEDNCFSNYFTNKELAQKEADRRNQYVRFHNGHIYIIDP